MAPPPLLQLLTSAALLAIHTQAAGRAFRQRDVRFYIELFSNWIELDSCVERLRLHNTQISRELSLAVSRGRLRLLRGRIPTYRLTPLGLVEALRGVFTPRAADTQQYLFFRLYFLSNYGPRIRKLLDADRMLMPAGVRVEIDPLVDVRRLLSDSLQQARRDLARLELRIRHAAALDNEARRLLKRRLPFPKLVAAIEKLHPYELTSMKPLSALCAGLPQDLVLWEITEGSTRRAEQLWKPAHGMLKAYVVELEKALARSKRRE